MKGARRSGCCSRHSRWSAAGCRGGDDDGDAAASRSTPGVTDEPCPEAVNEDNGCIYLGTISDLTAGPVRAARRADHRRAEGVLAAGQRGRRHRRLRHRRHQVRHATTTTTRRPTSRSTTRSRATCWRWPRPSARPTTLAILPDMKSDDDRRRPGLVDLAVGLRGRHPRVRHQLLHRVDERRRLRGRGEAAIKSVMAVHFPGDYGGDGAAGAKIARRGERADVHRRRDRPRPGEAGRRDQRDRRARARPGASWHRPDRGRRDRRPGGRARLHRASSSASARPGTRRCWQTPAAPALEALYLQSGLLGPLRHRHRRATRRCARRWAR